MGTNTGNILTLANSIIGVSVLAMPFCFKQCGIVLAIVMLLFSSLISRLACHFLIKSALLEKRKNFEMLAFRVFGPTGKLMVELCIIGFMLGTCVAFFVIMGDLGPAILGPTLGFDHPSALRPSVLIGVAVFVVLPLGLLRNVDSLNAICAASILFYVCLVLKVLSEATTNMISWNWIDKVHLWRPSGALQCIPIFSMALSCQTQLFEIFDGFLNTPLDRMNAVVRAAINMTTVFYISVGLFGYIAYCNQTFAGNIMMNFSPTLWSDVIKLGFVLSVALSFPLVIFPCRASIHSLLFSKSGGYGYELVGASSHIPETRFQCITLVIVTSSLVVGLVMPNIEVVLGLIGSTIGVFICVITPGIMFTSLSTKNTSERIVAQMLVGIGLIIMVLGTYANLSATEEVVRESHVSDIKQNIKLGSMNQLPVTEMPARVAAKLIEDGNSKASLQDENKNKLQNTLVENSKKAAALSGESISDLQVKEIKESINNNLLKVAENDAKIDVKLEKDKTHAVVNPEPPPREIQKAEVPKVEPTSPPLVPLVLAPEVREVKTLVKEAKSNLESMKDVNKQVLLNNNITNSQHDKLGDGRNVISKSVPDKSDANNNEKSDVEDNKKVIDKLAMSMAQGVPLPLVAKDVKPMGEINKEIASDDVHIVKEVKKEKISPVERGLLEKYEVREKRDTEIEIKEGNEVTLQENNVSKSEVNVNKDENQGTQSEVEKHESIIEENCPRPTGQSDTSVKMPKEVIILEKSEIADDSKDIDKLASEQPEHESLIKAPVRLSQPEAELVIDPKLLPDNQMQGNNAMPKKRDLKSLNQRAED